MPWSVSPRVLAAGAALLVALTAGWLANGWRLGQDIEEIRSAQAEALAAARQQVAEAERLHRVQVSEIDETYTRELADAQDENNRLRADLLRGSIRLSIPTSGASCGVSRDTGTAGSADAAGAADIDEGAAAEILALTQRGDTAIRRLTALQGYVRTVCLARGEQDQGSATKG